MTADDDKVMAELDKSFDLLTTDPRSEAAYETMKRQDKEWKA